MAYKNREDALAYYKQYEIKNKEKKRLYKKQRYLENREAILQKARDNYKPHPIPRKSPEELRANSKESSRLYREKNREKLRLQSKKYKTPGYKERYSGIYGSWCAMKQRCDNKNHIAYHNYGGRGITYPETWKEFKNFQADMGSTYQKGLTIDRIDNNASYSKENCRWATRKVQANNSRRNVLLSHDGQTHTLSEWSDILKTEAGIKYRAYLSRYLRGWKTEDILSVERIR